MLCSLYLSLSVVIKKVQQELIRDAGMRSVRQAAGKKWEDVEEFLQKETYPVVLKPTDSAGSDGVKLCHNIEEAKEHFHLLFEVEAVNGGFNTEVLCQQVSLWKHFLLAETYYFSIPRFHPVH
jgi:biotin carboxylase